MMKINSSHKINGYLLFFFGIFCSNLVEAFPIVLKRDITSTTTTTTTSTTTNNNNNNNQNKINEEIVRKIVAAVAVIIGFCICFFGHRLYRKIIFFIGFFAGSFLARSIITSLKSDINAIILYICVYIISLICGTLAFYVYKFSLCILGILAASCINGMIISFFPIIGEKINPIIIISILSLIFIIFIFKFEIPIIIIYTSISGSFMMIYCIDILIDSGLTRSLQSMFDNDKYENTNSNLKIRSLDIISLLGAILGCIVQFIYYSRHKNLYVH